MTGLIAGLAGISMAGGGSGSAAAGAGSGSAKAAGGGSGSAAPAAMEMPKAPQELLDMQKKMVGTWKCTGKVGGPSGQMRDTSGNLTFSVDLDKWWIKASLTETKTKTPYKFESFVTYDTASKKWANVSIDNVGGYRVLTSDGMKDNAVTWTGTATAMGKSVQVKSVHTMVNDKDNKIDESISMDNGKTWMPTVAVECKK
ncbi:MAG TPA: DUF1579 family protein [Kofleriaceae bacterium]|nr:DUF1579 family protein [Kofleriaceae bacterium]